MANEAGWNIKITREKIIIGLALLIALGGLTGGYLLYKAGRNKAVSKQSSPVAGYNLAIYYPTNLPTGYTLNKDQKVLKPDVLYYSVTDSRNRKYFVTLQALPSDFDFTAFNKKFLKPDQYNVNIGTVVAGPVGASLIASIQTTKNVWIIINASDSNALSQLETITRSFQLSS